MKRLVILALALCWIGCASTLDQLDQHGNPIFNSVRLKDDTTATYILSGGYYTIKNNIENRHSSVYVADHPTIQQIVEFARTKPSCFFMIHNADNVVANIIGVFCHLDGKRSAYSFVIANPTTNRTVEIPARTRGDFPELRAAELGMINSAEKAQSLTLGPKKMVLVDGTAYSVQSLDELKAEIHEVVKRYHLENPDVDLSKISE